MRNQFVSIPKAAAATIIIGTKLNPANRQAQLQSHASLNNKLNIPQQEPFICLFRSATTRFDSGSLVEANHWTEHTRTEPGTGKS